MGRIKPYSQAVSNVRVNNLLERAYRGETTEIREKAKAELIGRNKALARRANIQLGKLEKAGYTRWAYDRAIAHIEHEMGEGVNRFSGRENDFDDLKDIAWNIREMSNFLRSKQATVGGNREIDREILESFRNKSKEIGIDKDGNPILQYMKISDIDEKALFDLLNSDSWEELKKTYYGSQDAIDMLIQVTNYDNGTTLDWDRLQEQLDKVSRGDIDEETGQAITLDKALEEFGYKI